jgi:hypothetical protein
MTHLLVLLWLAMPTSIIETAADTRSLDVTFPGGADDVELAGTLLIPPGLTADTPGPGIVLVTGSGAQDRDESIAGKKPFRVLAEGLTARGFVVLRYDDRGTKALGIGASTGSFAGSTTGDFAEDAAAALAFLAQREEVDAARVVLCGHSTGGLIAAHLLGSGRVPAAAVIIAGPAVRGVDLLARQQGAILAATHAAGRTGLSDEQFRELCERQEAFVFAVVDGDAAAAELAARELIATQLRIQMKSADAVLPEAQMTSAVRSAIAPLQEVWMDYFLRYDPIPSLRSARVPVLALYGGRDLQVLTAQNSEPMTQALAAAGDPLSRVIQFPVHNHLFQRAVTGLLDEYGALPDDFDPHVVTAIADWLEPIVSKR